MKNRGNILIVFIMLIGLSFIVFSIATVVTTHVKQSGIKSSEMRAFYAAEAGLNKVVWYLGTSVSGGGKGSDWRGTTTESFSYGSYQVTVQDVVGSSEVLIISTGEVEGISKTVMQRASMTGALPPVFNNAVFSNGIFKASGNAKVYGDVFVNGNTTLTGNANVSDGVVYHPEGYSVSGNATDGGVPDPLPGMPTFDTSYYDSQIAIAEAYPVGDQSFTDLNLDGGTIYVNGTVYISGNSNISGPGTIVTTGGFQISGNTISDGSNITFITGGESIISGNTTLPNSSFYADDLFKASGNLTMQVGSVLTSGDINMSGNVDFSGLVYAEGTVKFSGNVQCDGSVVSDNFDTISGNVNITHDPNVLPSSMPIGFSSDFAVMSLIRGTWQEL